MTSKDTSRRAGLTQTRVITCAVALTKERGLQGWTVRDLAATLDVAPSVIYHYFPNKTEIHRGVRDRVCTDIQVPPETLDWQEWFIEALTSLRHTLLAYNGLTRHLMDSLEHGRPPEQLLPLFETAIAKLTEAGLTTGVLPAYSMIINVTLGAIEQHDRQSPLSANRHDITAMISEMEPLARTSQALAALREDYLAQLPTAGGEAVSEHYFRLLLRAILSGIDQTLIQPTKTPSPGDNP